MELSAFEQRLLNDFQHHFPLTERPFNRIAELLGSDEQQVIDSVRSLKQRGVISRIGPVFSPNSVGASTLAAIAVPIDELESTAELVNAFAEVNHNYEREHAFNLWFVATAANQESLDDVLEGISDKTGFRVVSLPLLRDYHIDLGFNLNFGNHKSGNRQKVIPMQKKRSWKVGEYVSSAIEEKVIQAVQSGLPFCERPYDELAQSIGLRKKQLTDVLQLLYRCGVIRRWGVVVRHHELGYRSNAMVVWDVLEDKMDRIAGQLSGEDCVTLCYERPRSLPDWPYNLFCMIHGKDRQQVLASIDAMVDRFGLDDIPHDVLFSRRRFKQRGARYRDDINQHSGETLGGHYG